MFQFIPDSYTCLENSGNFGVTLKFCRNFGKSELQLSNYRILGAQKVFEGAESISTIKKKKNNSNIPMIIVFEQNNLRNSS